MNEDIKYKNELQQLADIQELKRFIRKWGVFGHIPKPVYDVAFEIEIDQFVDFNLLKAIEPFCTRLYLSDKTVADQLLAQLEFEASYYSNLRWGWPTEHWESVKHLHDHKPMHDRILNESVTGDIVVSCKYSDLLTGFTDLHSVFENIHEIVSANEVGKFKFGPLTVDIKRKNDVSWNYKKCAKKVTGKEFMFV